MKKSRKARRQQLTLNDKIIRCQKCPRLIEHCQRIARVKRRQFADFHYWGQPVPNLGNEQGKVLIVGLAPAAHGANRTGRMFTGDRSGDWLFRSMHKFGFCNQAVSVNIDDGLEIHDCLITAICHCAPPDNKPTTEEIKNCQEWFDELLDKSPFQVVIALGQIGWQGFLRRAKSKDWFEGAMPKFAHGAQVELSNGRTLIGSYHPSQQNTFTRRLTEEMLDDIFEKAQSLKRIDERHCKKTDTPRILSSQYGPLAWDGCSRRVKIL